MKAEFFAVRELFVWVYLVRGKSQTAKSKYSKLMGIGLTCVTHDAMFL